MDSQYCIIHYSQLKFNNISKLKPVTEVSFSVLKEAKEDRQKLGGTYFHEEQCCGVPDKFAEGLFYHYECYNNFTKAISQRRNRIQQNPSTSTECDQTGRPRRSIEIDHAGRFPEYCMFCKKVEKRFKKKSATTIREFPTKVTLSTTQTTLLEAAKLKNDHQMIHEIEGVDLMVKDFRKHPSCYNEYTKIVTNAIRNPHVKEASRYDLTKQVIEKTVLNQKKCLSIDILLDESGIDEKTRDGRRKMKLWIQRNYGDEIIFLTPESGQRQVIVSKQLWEDISTGSQSISSASATSNIATLKQAVTILRRMITNYTDTAESLPWPPTVESLQKRLETTPELLNTFFKLLVSPEDSHHISAESTGRIAESFSQDLIFAVTKGTFLTLKHTSLGIGLHSITGLKLPIIMLSRLGHSISYDTVREIETAEAELAEEFYKDGKTLPILPIDESSFVPTIFWWDNFDRFVDNTTGAGSIHNTPGVAFQEEIEGTAKRLDISIPRSKRKSILIPDDQPTPKKIKINPKKNPKTFKIKERHSREPSQGDKLLCAWKVSRQYYKADQRFPRFAGWIFNSFKRENEKQTLLTYLPPIETPITDYGTLFEVFYKSEQLSKESNMTYTHIVMDCGAAMKAYHIIWNNPGRFKHIILHLGDFHFMQGFFGVVGNYVTGSGFENIIYQLGLCQPGSMSALIKGKHYNQAWQIHESFSEAIFRLFLERFVDDVHKEKLHTMENPQLVQDADVKPILELFKRGLEGEFGITAQFWLQYVYFVDLQHSLHLALQTNNLDEKLHCWSKMLPIFFFFDKIHYSRYGTYYLKSMENIDDTHPGAKQEMMKVGISVRRNNHGIGQAVDLAGEQSYIKNAKTIGGMTFFQTRKATVLKWVRNRSFTTKFAESLKEMAGIQKTTYNPKKCLRPSEIIKSNNIVEKIVDVMVNQFMEPFDNTIDKQKLYNLVSGRPVKANVANSLSSVREVGNRYFKDFETRMESNHDKAFHDSITKNKQPTFKSCELKLKLCKKDSKHKETEIEKNVLGILLAESCKNEKIVDIKSALTYPLSPVPPALCTPDGGMRKTKKSDLLNILAEDIEVEDSSSAYETCDTYMQDLAAFVRTVVSQCKTVRDLGVRLIKSIPKNCKRVYVMVDSYTPKSIKSSERVLRGDGERYVLRNFEMKVPFDIEDFLAVGENKAELFMLIQRFVEESPPSDHDIFFCHQNKCTKISMHGILDRPDLANEYEEADYMFIAYAANEEGGVMIRSPSGDVDIIATLVGHKDNISASVYVDNGTGKDRKVLKLDTCGISPEQCNAVIGVHAFSGNDYIPSFFRKGKKTSWKVACKNATFLSAFTSLGTNYEISSGLVDQIEHYVCAMYGKSKLKNVNEARSVIFWDKYNKQKKIIDLSMLPPCKGNLILHLKRSNYVAYMMRHANELKPRLESHEHHGWTSDATAVWMDTYVPEDIADILVTSQESSNTTETTDDHEEYPEFEDVESIEDDNDVDIEQFD